METYLAELGAEPGKRGIKKPLHMMLIGVAYMLLLAGAPRTTDDIDIFWLEEDAFQPMRATLSKWVLAVTKRHALPLQWFNYLTQILIQNEVSAWSSRHPQTLHRTSDRLQQVHS